jgi:hypothetical protein
MLDALERNDVHLPPLASKVSFAIILRKVKAVAGTTRKLFTVVPGCNKHRLLHSHQGDSHIG